MTVEGMTYTGKGYHTHNLSPHSVISTNGRDLLFHGQCPQQQKVLLYSTGFPFFF
jgi:hypothetical protein